MFPGSNLAQHGWCAILFCSLFLLGCSTTQSRIAQHQVDFDQLPVAQREMIVKGQVDMGFSPAMVYMAMGAPNRKIQQKNLKGESVVWVYLQSKTEFYTIDYAGALHCRRGFSSITPVTGTRQVPYEAVRVQFKDNAVVSLETQAR